MRERQTFLFLYFILRCLQMVAFRTVAAIVVVSNAYARVCDLFIYIILQNTQDSRNFFPLFLLHASFYSFSSYAFFHIEIDSLVIDNQQDDTNTTQNQELHAMCRQQGHREVEPSTKQTKVCAFGQPSLIFSFTFVFLM